MKISVVIPNFNGAKLLKNNLPRVLSAVQGADVVVVDDASTDDSVAEIKNQISKIKNTNNKINIRLLENETNLGFSSTVNRGVREASGELILLLNTDVVPQDGFLKYLIPHFADPQIFAVGCQQLREGKINEGRGVGKFEKGFLMHGPGELDKKNTLWVFGGAGMFRKSVWEKLGGLDTLYNPFYWEDIDLSYRALKAGYKLAFEPKSLVFHNQEKGAIRSLYSPEQIRTIAYRNQILFVWLNITDFRLLFGHFIYLPYHLIKSIVGADFSFGRGFFLAIAKIHKIISHRVHKCKFNRFSDEEILNEFNG